MRWLACVLLLTGCAHSGWHTSNDYNPLDDGSWHALTSVHFVLYSDQPPSLAAYTLDELERATVVLGAAAFAGARLPEERVDVILLDEVEQLQMLTANDKQSAFFVASDDVTTRPHVLVLAVPTSGLVARMPMLRETALHEITHAFVRRTIPRAPTWLNEGMAVYWESLEIGNEGLIVGRPPMLDYVNEWPSLPDVIEAGRFYGRPDARLYYAASWGAVHELYEQHATELARFVAALSAGQAQAAAWKASFGLSPAELDAEMRRRYASDQPLARRLSLPPLPSSDPDAVRAVDRAGAQLLFARVALLGKKPALAASYLDAAQQLGSAATELPLLRAALAELLRQDDRAKALVDDALAVHADDPALLQARARTLLVLEEARPEAQRNWPALEPTFAQLVKARPSASALAMASSFAVARGRTAEALRLAEQSVARNDQCVPCLDTLARVRERLGDHAGAVEAERRAVAAWPYERAPTGLLARLGEYERSARGR